MCAVDLFGERNNDEELLASAAANGRVLATCDEPIHRIARGWIGEMTDGDVVEAFEEIAATPDAFAYPVEYIKSKR